MRPLALALVAVALASAAPAGAGPTITLNGVSIDGAIDQRIENATVVIDAQGNVHIEAKGYAVHAAGNPAALGPASRPAGSTETGAASPARLTRRYFLATEHSQPGTQYDLAIFINAQWIREVKSTEPSAVMEITKYLRPGPNKLTLAATKRLAGQRLAVTQDAALRVVVGEGNVGGDHLMIDVPLVETTRTAAEMDDRTEEFVIEAR